MTKLVNLFRRSVTRKSYDNDTKYHERIDSLFIVVILVNFATKKTYNIRFNLRKRKNYKIIQRHRNASFTIPNLSGC